MRRRAFGGLCLRGLLISSVVILSHGIRDHVDSVNCHGPDCLGADSLAVAERMPHVQQRRSLISLREEAALLKHAGMVDPNDPAEDTTTKMVRQHSTERTEPVAVTQDWNEIYGVDMSKLMQFWMVAFFLYASMIALVVWLNRGFFFSRDDEEQCDPLPNVNLFTTVLDAFQQSRGGTLGFKDTDLEILWTKFSKKKRVEVGTWTLFLLTVVMIIYQLLRLEQNMKIECIQPINMTPQFAKFSFFGGLLIALGLNVKQGSNTIFWFALVFYFFFVPAVNMPPYGWSCGMLATGKCKEDGSNWYLLQAKRHADCTLCGSTALQMMMTWLLTLPWIMPRYELMHYCWLWILLVFVGWTVAWQRIVEGQDIVFNSAMIRDRVYLLGATLMMATGMKYFLERSERSKFLRDRKQREAGKDMFVILEDMLPLHVIKPMMQGETIAEPIERVSILFVLIAEFDKKTQAMGPARLLAYLNERFSIMDDICCRNRVTKIETVGEEYVAAVGVLPEDVEENKNSGHAAILKRLLQAAGEILMDQCEDDNLEQDARYKMGIHTGPIVAGVIGSKLPRYRLFGNTINQAARMMQKAPIGELQFGEETKSDVPPEMFGQVKDMGKVPMKGKGDVQAYTWSPGNDFVPTMGGLANAPDSGAPRRRSVLGLGSNGMGQRPSLPGSEDPSSRPNPLAQKISEARRVNRMYSDQSFQNPDAVAARGTFKNQTRTMRSMDNDLDKRFTLAVGDLTEFQGAKALANKATRNFLSEGEGMEEFEEEWLQQHHEEQLCKSIASRYGLEAVLLILASGYELAFMFQEEVWTIDHALYPRQMRDGVFIYARGAVLFMTIMWWYVADTRMQMVKENRKQAHAWKMVTYCLSVLLLYVSYDAFICSDSEGWRKKQEMNHQNSFKAPPDQIYMLNFLLFFFFISQQRSMLFWPSMIFIVLALFISVSDLIVNRLKPNPRIKFEAPISFLGKIMFVVQACLNTVVSYHDEQQSRRRFKQTKAVESTRKQTKHILESLMPELVVQQISENSTPSHQYRHATVSQSDLCGFTKLSADKEPKQVVEFMGELFGMFDVLTDKHGVYKVETVGDAYISAVAEPPLTKENNPYAMVLFALDMVRAVDRWDKKQGSNGVTCRVGVNYGECLGGIVGESMQRYHLFGDLLTQMEVLESTAPEGRVQVSTKLKDEVNRQLTETKAGLDVTKLQEVITFEMRRDEDLRTSKGEAHTYDSVGGRTFIVNSNRPLRDT